MVAIKGALMPRCCQNCFLIRYHDTLGYSCKATKSHITKFDVGLKRANDCPLVEIEERKVGKWIEEPNCWLRCSCCNSHYPHTSIYAIEGSNYCPNCGAEMRGAENG